mgnify:CR=1 FL=1
MKKEKDKPNGMVEKDWKGREYTPDRFLPRKKPPRLIEYFACIIWYGVPFSIIYTIVKFLTSLLQ